MHSTKNYPKTKMSWFLFYVTTGFTDDDGTYQAPGDKGVGMCSMAPGIMEVPNGILYVIPEAFVEQFHVDKRQRRYCASIVVDAVQSYYGIILK